MANPTVLEEKEAAEAAVGAAVSGAVQVHQPRSGSLLKASAAGSMLNEEQAKALTSMIQQYVAVPLMGTSAVAPQNGGTVRKLTPSYSGSSESSMSSVQSSTGPSSAGTSRPASPAAQPPADIAQAAAQHLLPSMSSVSSVGVSATPKDIRQQLRALEMVQAQLRSQLKQLESSEAEEKDSADEDGEDDEQFYDPEDEFEEWVSRDESEDDTDEDEFHDPWENTGDFSTTKDLSASFHSMGEAGSSEEEGEGGEKAHGDLKQGVLSPATPRPAKATDDGVVLPGQVLDEGEDKRGDVAGKSGKKPQQQGSAGQGVERSKGSDDQRAKPREALPAVSDSAAIRGFMRGPERDSINAPVTYTDRLPESFTLPNDLSKPQSHQQAIPSRQAVAAPGGSSASGKIQGKAATAGATGKPGGSKGQEAAAANAHNSRGLPSPGAHGKQRHASPRHGGRLPALSHASVPPPPSTPPPHPAAAFQSKPRSKPRAS